MDYPRRPHYNRHRESRPRRRYPPSDSWQNRGHPYERSRPQSRSPEDYRSRPREDPFEMCASRPMKTNDPDNPFYSHYLHNDPLGLKIDLRQTDVVVGGAAVSVAMFDSYPTTIEKIHSTFLGQQVFYLERVIRAMKDIIKRKEETYRPWPVTEERSTMRRKAALKRKVAPPEKCPIFNLKKHEKTEKEEGELDEEEFAAPTRKKSRSNLEKKTEDTKESQDPFMGLPLSPISEEDDDEENNASRRSQDLLSASYKKVIEKKAASENERNAAKEYWKPSKRPPPSPMLSEEDDDEESNAAKRPQHLLSASCKKEIERRAALAAASENGRNAPKESTRLPLSPMLSEDEIEEEKNRQWQIAVYKKEMERRAATEAAEREEEERNILTKSLMDDDCIDINLQKDDLIPDIEPSMPILLLDDIPTKHNFITRCKEDSPFVRKYTKTILK